MTTTIPESVGVVSYDPAITSYHPSTSIELGYNMYVADAAELEGTARRAAKVGIREFYQGMRHFAEGSRERAYLGRIWRSAISFGRGIARRKKELADNLALLREEKERALRHLAQTERSSGILMGGVQLFLLAGIVWLVTQLFVMIPGLGRLLSASPNGPNYMSLAFAMGSALVGSFFKHWKMTRDLRELFRWFEAERDKAYSRYASSVRDEYKLAAGTAAFAWLYLTGERPRSTKAFAELLHGVFPDNHGVSGSPS